MEIYADRDGKPRVYMKGNRVGLSLHQALIELGATEVQLNSKVFGLIEDALTNGEVSSSETAKEAMRVLDTKLDAMNVRSAMIEEQQKQAINTFKGIENKLAEADIATGELVISNKEVADGVVAFRKILESTQHVFGKESMTEAVICKAIEAASYGMWRSIMGPKWKE